MRLTKSLGAVGRFLVLLRENTFSDRSHFIWRKATIHMVLKGCPQPGNSVVFGGLILDEKLKSVSVTTSANLKSASLKISKNIGIDVPQENGNHSLSTNIALHSSVAFDLETVNTISTSPKTSVTSTLPTVSIPSALSAVDTELSLSFPTQSNAAPMPVISHAEVPNCSYVGIPYDKSLGQWVPQDKKDEMILELSPRVREVQNQLQEWTEWANQKVMQVARRLSKDKAEIKTLRQEKEEVERLKKEKLTLEENTMKKLSEMENALSKAGGQVGQVLKLEVENAALRQEMEAAKLRAAESAASCHEASKREKKTLVKFQSWEKQKTLLFQEELVAEKQKVTQLLQEHKQAAAGT